MDLNRAPFKIKFLPFDLIFLLILIQIIGVISLYSANKGNFYPYSFKQLTGFILLLIIAIIIAISDIKNIYKISYPLFLISIILVIFVEIYGSKALGAKRWINIIGIGMQPSEIFKIAMILFLSKYYHNQSYINSVFFKKYIIPLSIIIIPIFLIIKQPDLGTGLITLFIAIFIVIAAGINYKIILISSLSIVSAMPFIWNLLKNYQKKRILIFLNPETDPLGAGYNIIQSKIAIGSGGLFGKGFLNGSQINLDFLPENQTDFIFSGFAEEFGLFGCIILMILYMLVIIKSYFIALNSRSIFGKLMVVGIISEFFLHVYINISMVMGILPVVGIPLPFMSYGRTILASIMIGFGLIMNVNVHQKTYLKFRS